jgi:hypothetical protein
MTDTTKTKLYQAGPRTFIYLQKPFVTDGAFPFKVGEPLEVKIQGEKLVITKAKKS